MGSWYNEDCGRDAGQGLSGFIMRFFLKHIIGKTLQDMKRMHQYLREHCTDLNWSIVNPPGLTNGALTRNGFVYEEGDRIKERCNQVQRMSRADVARFMLETAAMGIHNQPDQNQKQIAVNMQIWKRNIYTLVKNVLLSVHQARKKKQVVVVVFVYGALGTVVGGRK